MNIYISGPITGVDPMRCDITFDLAKNAIREKGHFPVSPWDLGKILPSTFKHSDYMDVDMVILEKMDAIVMLDGWESSQGCTYEFGYACRTDMPIYYGIDEIPSAEV